MKEFEAQEGYKYVFNGDVVSMIAAPDDFDESQLQLVTDEEANEILKKIEESKKSEEDKLTKKHHHKNH